MSPQQLLFINLPYNCSDRELKEWIEIRGIEIDSVRIIHDLVSGVSPAFGYAELRDSERINDAVASLDGTRMRNQTVAVRLAAPRRTTQPTIARAAKR